MKLKHFLKALAIIFQDSECNRYTVSYNDRTNTIIVRSQHPDAEAEAWTSTYLSEIKATLGTDLASVSTREAIAPLLRSVMRRTYDLQHGSISCALPYFQKHVGQAIGERICMTIKARATNKGWTPVALLSREWKRLYTGESPTDEATIQRLCLRFENVLNKMISLMSDWVAAPPQLPEGFTQLREIGRLANCLMAFFPLYYLPIGSERMMKWIDTLQRYEESTRCIFHYINRPKRRQLIQNAKCVYSSTRL